MTGGHPITPPTSDTAATRRPSASPIESQGLTIWTARFTNPSLANMPEVKIATTRGYPRFRLPYDCVWWKDYGPERRLWHLDWPMFRGGYLEQLDAMGGQAALIARCRQVAIEHHAPGVVLACYEDLRTGDRCHREILAEYLGAAEVTDNGPTRRKAPQQTLFDTAQAALGLPHGQDTGQIPRTGQPW